MLQIYIKFSLLAGRWHIVTAKIKMRQYVIFIEPRKFDTADIQCFTVSSKYTKKIRP